MNGLKQFWTKIVGIVEALEGMDDPKGDYMSSLEKRVDGLERDLKNSEASRTRAPAAAE